MYFTKLLRDWTMCWRTRCLSNSEIVSTQYRGVFWIITQQGNCCLIVEITAGLNEHVLFEKNASCLPHWPGMFSCEPVVWPKLCSGAGRLLPAASTTGAVGLTCISVTLSSRSRSQGMMLVALTESAAHPLATTLLVHSYFFEEETVQRNMLWENTACS